MESPLKKFSAKLKSYRATQDVEGQENPTFQLDDDKANGDTTPTQKSNPTTQTEKTEGAREQWSNPTEFLLSCVAMSVGLGNVWRFPFTAYENGGGAFLIPYVIILVVIGKPLYYMELCMGQFASYGSVKIWEMVPGLKGIGLGQAVASWCVVTYYVSLMALTLFYFGVSFNPVLPWSSCNGAPNCFDASTNLSLLNLSNIRPASEIYYEDEVIKLDRSGLANGISLPDWKLTLCLLSSWIILFLVLVRGVKSSGKAAYFTALFPYVVIFILLGRGASLPGAAKGMWFFINPQWEKILEPTVWFKAVGQSFFSLAVGFGSITMFSSYNDFRHNVYRDAAIVSVIDTLTSFIAGLTIFAILGHLAEEIGVGVEDVLKGGGSGLAFISYPDVLSRFDFVPQLFAVLFFLMMFTLGVGSASALTGSIITIISDKFPNFPKYFITLIVCIAGFFLGLFYVTPQGQYILDLIDYFGGNFIVFIFAFLEVIAVHWIYGMKNFLWDIEFMLGRKTGIYWRICWAVAIPFILIFIFIGTLSTSGSLSSGGYVFGSGAIAFGICLTLFALATLPVLFILQYRKSSQENVSKLKALSACFQPTLKWGPQDSAIRREYEKFIEGKKNERRRAAQEYFDVEGEVYMSPMFHFKRMICEFKFWILEIFWRD